MGRRLYKGLSFRTDDILEYAKETRNRLLVAEVATGTTDENAHIPKGKAESGGRAAVKGQNLNQCLRYLWLSVKSCIRKGTQRAPLL